MKRFQLSEHQKDLLTLMSLPAFMLLTGLILGWTQLGSQIIKWFKLSMFQFVMVAFFSLIIILIGSDLELRLLKFVKPSESAPMSTSERFKKRWSILLGFIIVIAFCFLLYLVPFWGGDKQALIQLAQLFIWGGLAFLVRGDVTAHRLHPE